MIGYKNNEYLLVCMHAGIMKCCCFISIFCVDVYTEKYKIIGMKRSVEIRRISQTGDDVLCFITINMPGYFDPGQRLIN